MECVHASSVNMFKNRIDKYLVKAGYTGNKGMLHLEYVRGLIIKTVHIAVDHSLFVVR